MLREPLKQRTCESLSADAEHGGGVIHSRDETAVMVVERRPPMSGEQVEGVDVWR